MMQCYLKNKRLFPLLIMLVMNSSCFGQDLRQEIVLPPMYHNSLTQEFGFDLFDGFYDEHFLEMLKYNQERVPKEVQLYLVLRAWLDVDVRRLFLNNFDLMLETIVKLGMENEKSLLIDLQKEFQMYPEPRLLEGDLKERVHSLLKKFTKEVKSSDYFKIIDIAGNNILDYSLDTISWMNPIINKPEVYIRKDSIYEHLFHVEHKDDNQLIYFENTGSFSSNYYKYFLSGDSMYSATQDSNLSYNVYRKFKSLVLSEGLTKKYFHKNGQLIFETEDTYFQFGLGRDQDFSSIEIAYDPRGKVCFRNGTGIVYGYLGVDRSFDNVIYSLKNGQIINIYECPHDFFTQNKFCTESIPKEKFNINLSMKLLGPITKLVPIYPIASPEYESPQLLNEEEMRNYIMDNIEALINFNRIQFLGLELDQKITLNGDYGDVDNIYKSIALKAKYKKPKYKGVELKEPMDLYFSFDMEYIK